MTPEAALRAAMSELVGRRVVASRPRLTNAQRADAAGFKTAAQARAAAAKEAGSFPSPFQRRSIESAAAKARTARQTYLKSLQREKKNKPPTEILSSAAVIARQMQIEGVTVDEGWDFHSGYDDRERLDMPSVAFRPSDAFVRAVERGDWASAATHFFNSWGVAYAEVVFTVEDVRGLHLSLGNVARYSSFDDLRVRDLNISQLAPK